MKILIVAHPDDEAIWFHPQEFDEIHMAFLGRHDRKGYAQKRLQALDDHPLKTKIYPWGLWEPGFWKDEKRQSQYESSKKKVWSQLSPFIHCCRPLEIYTHNAWGEYGHADHVLLNESLRQVAQRNSNVSLYSPAVKDEMRSQRSVSSDPDLVKAIQKAYVKHGVWTWKDDFTPPPYFYFEKQGEVL